MCWWLLLVIFVALMLFSRPVWSCSWAHVVAWELFNSTLELNGELHLFDLLAQTGALLMIRFTPSGSQTSTLLFAFRSKSMQLTQPNATNLTCRKIPGSLHVLIIFCSEPRIKEEGVKVWKVLDRPSLSGRPPATSFPMDRHHIIIISFIIILSTHRR